MTKMRGGFTLIEIMVVIAILAILTAVIILAYNGVQQRARNAQIAATVKEYKDALVLARSQTGSYPEPTTPGTRVCLGNNYPTSQCWFGAGATDSTFMTSLQGVTGGKLPMPVLPNVNLKGVMYVASSLGNRVDGASYAAATPVAMLVYGVEGDNTRCPVGPIASKPNNGNYLWYSATPPASGQTVAAGSGNPAQCWLILPYK